jgi:phospholipid/cholesterol/gamma-HCH transport system permease protein
MNLFSLIGDFSTFFFRSLFIPWKIRTSRSRILEQVFNIGIGSLPIIIIIAAFTGTVPRYIVGTTVGRMVLIELGPILTALMISGRCASSMAAEIGSMRVTEQIDALEIMAIDPYRFLSLPRIVGTFIALPVLTIISEFIALGFGAVYAHYFLDIPFSIFSYGMTHFFSMRDFMGGLVKSLFFSLVIGASGCYFGFNVKGGAKEVGRAATYAVVTASILILVLDFLVALVIFG